MRMIVVGLGVQGHKRRRVAGAECIATVDPVAAGADYRDVADVPLADYDAALCCVPDGAKLSLLRYLLGNGKHVLVEKPLLVAADADLMGLEDLARSRGAICYTAYNHRFEPHFVAMRDLIASGELGQLYRCRMFYGNGTARLVRDSVWRDQAAGVVPDLGSHLLDTLAFWFGPLTEDLRIVSVACHENRAPDHVVFASEGNTPRLECEATLLMWRNHFTCDLLAERGSAHIRSLCKWGPSRFVVRNRMLPSGRPPERETTLLQDDPTWDLEYAYFRNLILSGASADLSHDRWLNRTLDQLCQDALKQVAA